MKKNKPLIIIAAILVLVAGGYFLVSGQREQSVGTDSPGVTSEEKTVAEKFTGTLKEAVALGVGMKCTYTVEGNEYEGYVKGENYRGRMKNADGQVGEVIMKNNCMWSWSEDEGQGVKTCFEVADSDVAEEDGESVSLWDQQGSAPNISYTCIPYAVTDSQFTPPSNIQFMDLDSMMQEYGY